MADATDRGLLFDDRHPTPPMFGDMEPIVREGEQRQARLLVPLDRPDPCGPIIHSERQWRRPDVVERMDRRNPRLVVSRWHGMDRSEHSFEIEGDYYILALALRPSKLSLWLGDRSYPHQDIVPGAVQITPPELLARVVHSEPYDFLHLHIPNLLLMECFEWSRRKWPTAGVVLRDPLPARDAQLHRLGNTLLSIADANDPSTSLFADFLGLAITTHVLNLYGDIASSPARPAPALPKWRLKRAIEFIEAHLDAPVALADVADAAGLSRMHFAAQFRRATGLRPHEYTSRRRVERAQTMLAATDIPLAELALEVGFSSQAHFTVVFKRFSGLTPHRWRQCYRQ